jgi:hypothetical protein
MLCQCIAQITKETLMKSVQNGRICLVYGWVGGGNDRRIAESGLRGEGSGVSSQKKKAPVFPKPFLGYPFMLTDKRMSLCLHLFRFVGCPALFRWFWIKPKGGRQRAE